MTAGPTEREAELARKWLAKGGARVAHPTPFLSIRIGGLRTGSFSSLIVSYLIFAPLIVVGTFAYLSLRGGQMTVSGPVYFVFFAQQLAIWRLCRTQERAVGKRLAVRRARRRREVLDGWTLATVSITFGGGALLGIAMFLTIPSAWTYAWSWLGLLAIGAICTAVVLRSAQCAPAVADDEASAAVDELIHTEYADSAMPAIYAIPVPLDLLYENRQPQAFTWLVVAYAVLSLGVQAVAVLRRRRRKLPPGNYGLPAETAESTGVR